MTLRTITVSGSHYDCGYQIGAACADALRRSIDNCRNFVTGGQRWEDYRTAAQPYLAATERAFPWIIREIRGAADGAGVDCVDLFTISVEELFATPPDLLGRCSDFAACAPATEGHVLLAHNNDLSPATQESLVGVEWRLPDHPTLFTVGAGGLYLSIGLNSARICLTGNELSPNDERPGIPRLLVARALLSARTFARAVNIALHADRASSYNNLISAADGQIASVEASATDYELLRPEDGWLVHTNHYTHPRMKKHERMPGIIAGSVSRFNRARELMQRRPGPATLPMLKTFLSDHHSSPASLCRHSEKNKTVFSVLIDLTEGTLDAAVGNPCQSEYARVWSF